MPTAMCVLTLASLFAVAANAQYCQHCGDNNAALFSNLSGEDTLERGDWLYGNNMFAAVMQWDSNFVVYEVYHEANWVWFSPNIYGSGATRVVMQGDGNVVAVKDDGTPVWATHTDGRGKGPYCLTVEGSSGPDLRILDSNCDRVWKAPWTGRVSANETQETREAVDDISKRIAQDPTNLDAIVADINNNATLRSAIERLARPKDDEEGFKHSIDHDVPYTKADLLSYWNWTINATIRTTSN
ncbi:Aste57867_15059 [Aphanomyces stellatus]|uniref:Aste57867_15059 protein n=1 Tax=Aphanomyces stellatus TaxID=120398 RepID=A0A485L4X9_9STRA|nr:hypothetical protein As57867_015003 [Aphanomyces stellatus]VFT91873.1 Aste57867_15059 [Aphanomyces stellatus]